MLEECVDASRSLTLELSPPSEHRGTIGPVLDWLAGWMEQKHGCVVTVSNDGCGTPKSEDLIVLLYQSTSELLFNVVKHAHAAAARVDVRHIDGGVEVTVSDTGSGFDPGLMQQSAPAMSRFGLFGSRERIELIGGRMDIDSAPGEDCRVTLWTPVAADRSTSRRRP